MYYAWPHVMGVSSTVILLPYIVGVTTPILQRGNLTYHMSWVWPHPYFREKTLHTICCGVWPHPYFREKNLHTISLARPYSIESNLYMPCAMGWNFFEKSMGVGTPMTQGRYIYWNACMWNHGCSHMPYIVVMHGMWPFRQCTSKFKVRCLSAGQVLGSLRCIQCKITVPVEQ